MYHNTTHSTGPELHQFRSETKAQDMAVLEFYRAQGRALTPSQVWKNLFNQSCPLTSVRRAITNLTNDGLLEKTTVQVNGPYGRPEYLWRIPAGQLRLI